MKITPFCFYFLMSILFFFFHLSLSAQKQEGIEEKVKALNDLAFELRLSSLDSALILNHQAVELLNGSVNLVLQSEVFSVAGTLEMLREDYDNALNYQFQSLKLREELDSALLIGRSHLNIANTYYNANQYRKALEYNRRALERITSDTATIILVYNSMGVLFNDIGQYDSANYYLTKGIVLADKYSKDTIEGQASLLNNRGISGYGRGMLDKAKLDFERAGILSHKLNDYSEYAFSLHWLGILEEDKGNFQEAIVYYQKADSIARSIPDLLQQKEIAYSLLICNLHLGETDSALSTLESFVELGDKINQEINDENLHAIEAKYQVEKKEQELALSEMRREKSEAERERGEVQKWLLSGILVLVVIAGLFMYRTYRQKQYISQIEVEMKDKEMKELLAKQETESYYAMLDGQERERQRIAKELHDRLGSTLATLKLSLDVNNSREKNVEVVNLALEDLRSISHNLSSGILEKHGLNAALKELKNLVQNAATIDVQLYLAKEESHLGLRIELELYRIVQELVSNTLKHANATMISLQTTYTKKGFNLIYEDDGKGFDEHVVKKGIGLRNIQSRVEKIGGSFSFDAAPGRGMIFIVDLNKT